ncbi:ATP-binding protein [Marinilabilia salmonicolor]|uniref:ATP-binding protein n=1 Tax=Marinilabilia salmonicolor TaxID=989 RepID=UPI0035BE782D
MIITTNKSPKDWVEFLEDSVIVTAILDRRIRLQILFRCDKITRKRIQNGKPEKFL